MLKDKIKGKRLYCQAHKISVKKRSVVSGDKHHEDSAKLKSGYCVVEVPFKWNK